MATNLQQLPPLPAPAEPLVEPKTGLINTTWYLWFKRLDDHVREIEQRIYDLENP
jgi:hypothetical protein